MSSTVLNTSNIYIQKIHPLLCEKVKKFDKNYLAGIFSKFIEKITFIENLYTSFNKISSSNPNIKEQIIKVKTFALHYLLRGSVIPILCEKEKGHRSPLDYYENNKSSYYRGDGSSIHRLFLSSFLPNDFTDKNNKYRIGVIKPLKFAPLMQKACKSWDYEFQSIIELEDVTAKEKTFFNISDWVRGDLKQDLSNLPELITQAQSAADQLHDSSILGGVFQSNPYVGVYIFFTKDKSAQLSDNKSRLAALIGDLLNLRGNVGAFPEMLEIKSALAKREYPWSWNELQTETVDLTDTNPVQEIQNLITYLSTKDSHALSIYINIITKFLQAFLTEKISYFNEESKPIVFQKTSYSLKIIKNQIDLITNTSSFYENLQNIYLAFEEIFFLSLFFKPEKIVDLETSLKQLFDAKLQDDLIVFGWNSGMACYDAIIETIRSAIKQEESLPRLGIVQGTYYELGKELTDYLQSEWQIEKIDPKNFAELNVDLLLLDLYPNDVTLKDMRANPVQELIKQALKSHSSQFPLTVVLDVTTTLFSDPQILAIKQKFAEEILSGQLNLIVASSLAKFYNCGLDKYTGGAIAIFGSSDTPLFRKNMINQLASLRRNDIMSDEAKRFFSLLFIHAQEEIKTFYQTIIKNTQLIYTRLADQNMKSFLIKKRDEEIPMIGIATQNSSENEEKAREIFKKIQLHLYKEAQKQDLSLLIRASFPFPHSAVIECETSLRLVAGLDISEFIDGYPKIFQSVDQDLEKKVGLNLKEIKLSLLEIK